MLRINGSLLEGDQLADGYANFRKSSISLRGSNQVNHYSKTPVTYCTTSWADMD